MSLLQSSFYRTRVRTPWFINEPFNRSITTLNSKKCWDSRVDPYSMHSYILHMYTLTLHIMNDIFVCLQRNERKTKLHDDVWKQCKTAFKKPGMEAEHVHKPKPWHALFILVSPLCNASWIAPCSLNEVFVQNEKHTNNKQNYENRRKKNLICINDAHKHSHYHLQYSFTN